MLGHENLAMQGRCHCGALQYEVTAMPFDADFCHCRDCQRTTGAPVGVWADFKTEQVRWLSGELKEYASSAKVRRGFCPHCGSSLSYRNTDYPEYFTLSIASLDDQDAIVPRYHIHTDTQVKWLNIVDALEKYPHHRKRT